MTPVGQGSAKAQVGPCPFKVTVDTDRIAVGGNKVKVTLKAEGDRTFKGEKYIESNTYHLHILNRYKNGLLRFHDSFTLKQCVLGRQTPYPTTGQIKLSCQS